MVELAFILPLALILLLVTIQFAIIGAEALAVNQLAYAGARYAAANDTLVASDISTYMKSIASSLINENSGAHLTITVCVPSGNTCPTSTTTRVTGNPVKVGVSYDLSSKIVLPNPFLGIALPTTLSGTQTMMSE